MCRSFGWRSGVHEIRNAITFSFQFPLGTPLGRHRYTSGVHGAYGHSDPANGPSFFLRSTLSSPPPWPDLSRDTSLTIRSPSTGRGDRDSTVAARFFPPEVVPRTTRFQLRDGLLSLVAELSHAYLRISLWCGADEACLFLRQGVSSALTLSNAMTLHSLEWNFHSWESIAADR